MEATHSVARLYVRQFCYKELERVNMGEITAKSKNKMFFIRSMTRVILPLGDL